MAIHNQVVENHDNCVRDASQASHSGSTSTTTQQEETSNQNKPEQQPTHNSAAPVPPVAPAVDEPEFEIVTAEWKYENTDAYNFDSILPVKEQRRMGTSRGKKSTPQAPAIQVRLKGFTDRDMCVQADLWNYGRSSDLRQRRAEPSDQGEPLTKLRENVFISCTDNVAYFGPTLADGYRYATLRCYITRGARVQCRKNHIALRLVLNETKGAARTMVPIPGVSSIRTSRLSISEKAMCPRECDRRKKEKNCEKRKLEASRGFMATGSENPVAVGTTLPSGLSPTSRHMLNAFPEAPTFHRHDILSATNDLLRQARRGRSLSPPPQRPHIHHPTPLYTAGATSSPVDRSSSFTPPEAIVTNHGFNLRQFAPTPTNDQGDALEALVNMQRRMLRGAGHTVGRISPKGLATHSFMFDCVNKQDQHQPPPHNEPALPTTTAVTPMMGGRPAQQTSANHPHFNTATPGIAFNTYQNLMHQDPTTSYISMKRRLVDVKQGNMFPELDNLVLPNPTTTAATMTGNDLANTTTAQLLLARQRLSALARVNAVDAAAVTPNPVLATRAAAQLPQDWNAFPQREAATKMEQPSPIHQQQQQGLAEVLQTMPTENLASALKQLKSFPDLIEKLK